ncbi:DEAD/DEAH box helicase [Curtobacterium flaccumfaciens]|uniref:DEAD/DEAH box helicase n=1 Tax=Curtobacterium flaccumfaciens TaxID=2035 RepID=UPI002658539C|nr:DEAD/DEAH box helicase [Curtobacterium flaccumfaciens]MCS5504254.1 hypothetical protein [Curtobacterium flaccumfaciens pv. flaccumfaciens]
MHEFEELQAISRMLIDDPDETAARARFIRFLDSFDDSSALIEVVNALAVRFGLFPYVSGGVENLDSSDALAIAYHSPASLSDRNFVFHAEQQKVYARLLDGKNVVLSAPTSFGKSAILDALILSDKWASIVLIVPTIALIDETRRRLAALRTSYKIVSHPSQALGERNVFVLTQERYLEVQPRPVVDFFVIDEFYKLDGPSVEDERRSTLNIAWRELKETGAQYYLIGPNVQSLDTRVANSLREELYVTDYNTVLVDVEDRSSVESPLVDLQGFLETEADGPTLIFVSAPKRALELALEVSDRSKGSDDRLVTGIARWIGENYDGKWAVAEALHGGVGAHTGPMPRSLQRAMIRLFEMGRIDRLVCTTTLIEGVNTVARNVVIYDKKIDRKPIDFFTFSNIRGRAGRMLKHFVGRVVTYGAPPEVVETELDIPIETQSEGASLATLVQLESDELSARSKERLSSVLGQDFLSLATMRSNRGINPERQLAVAKELLDETSDLFESITWSGSPTGTQLRSVIELAYDRLLEPLQRRGVNSGSIMGKLSTVRQSAGSLTEMVERQYPHRHSGQSRSEVVDDILAFQRNWMGYRIPSMLRTVGSIQNEIATRRGLPKANYEFAIREIESLYLPPFIAELEDYGLPLPIAIKLSALGLRGATIEEVVASLGVLARRSDVVAKLSRVERWFLRDVAQGLERELQVSSTDDLSE